MLHTNTSLFYFSEFLVGCLDQGSRQNCTIVIEKCEEGTELAAIEHLLRGRIDGVLLPPPLGDSATALEALRARDVPVVAVSTGRAPDWALSVSIDDRKAAYEMTRHLGTLGHRRIGFITGASLFGAVTFLPIFLQIAQGRTPTESGLQLIPMTLGILAASTVAGQAMGRSGRYRWLPVVGLLSLAAGMLLRGASLHEAFLVGVSVAVAAVPEGLAATVTIALAQGARSMAARGAIVRRLSAVETLGSASVIATPSRPARPTRPMRCTYACASDGTS